MTPRTTLTAAAALALAAGVMGCTERHRSGTVALELSARPAALDGVVPPLIAGAGGAVVSLGHDSIIVRQAQVVLTEIQLAPVGGGECDPEEEDEEQCAVLDAGPVLLRLPLEAAAESLFTVRAPADTYIVFHFAIHAPSPRQDSVFIAAHPDFTGTSIRVDGTFSRAGKRADFTYVSDFNEQEEAALLPGLTVPPGGMGRLTLHVSLAAWFLSADKAALVNPATANRGQPNHSLVQDNIRRSVAVSSERGAGRPHDDRAAGTRPAR